MLEKHEINKEIFEKAAKTLELQVRALKLPPLEREVRFHQDRKWRFDFANKSLFIAIELEGGLKAFNRGRHIRESGFINDCEKYNQALCLGWKVLRVPYSFVKDGRAINWYEILVKLAQKQSPLLTPQMMIEIRDRLSNQTLISSLGEIREPRVIPSKNLIKRLKLST